MSGQSAMSSRKDVASKIKSIEKNSQSCGGMDSGKEKNTQTSGKTKIKSKK